MPEPKSMFIRNHFTVQLWLKRKKKQLFLNTNIRAQNDPAHWLDASPTTTFSEEKKIILGLPFC